MYVSTCLAIGDIWQYDFHFPLAGINWSNWAPNNTDVEINFNWHKVIWFGWLVVLRINVASAIFQSYRYLEAGDNLSLKIPVARKVIWSIHSNHNGSDATHNTSPWKMLYHISAIFRGGFIFPKFATSLKSGKIDTAKNKPYFMFSLRVFEIAKIRLGENLTHLPIVIFAKNSPTWKIPDIQYQPKQSLNNLYIYRPR